MGPVAFVGFHSLHDSSVCLWSPPTNFTIEVLRTALTEWSIEKVMCIASPVTGVADDLLELVVNNMVAAQAFPADYEVVDDLVGDVVSKAAACPRWALWIAPAKQPRKCVGGSPGQVLLACSHAPSFVLSGELFLAALSLQEDKRRSLSSTTCSWTMGRPSTCCERVLHARRLSFTSVGAKSMCTSGEG